MTAQQCQILIEQYIATCNEALLKNANRFPFKQILGAAEKYESGRLVEAIVDGAHAKHNFVLTISGGKIAIQSHDTCEKRDCSRQWSVSKEYLGRVAADRDSYIENPAKINWDWLYNA